MFLCDRVAGTTTLVSRAAGSPVTAANDDSRSPGHQRRRPVRGLREPGHGPGGGPGGRQRSRVDVFLYDRVAGTKTLVSRTPGSVGDHRATDGRSRRSSAPMAGSWPSSAEATNLVAGQVDANGDVDVFLFDRVTGTTTLVSRAAGSAVATGDGVRPSRRSSAPTGVRGLRQPGHGPGGGPGRRQRRLRRVPVRPGTGTTKLVSRPAASAVTTGRQRSGTPGDQRQRRLRGVHERGHGPGGRPGRRQRGRPTCSCSTGGPATTTLVSRTTASTVTTTGSCRSESPAISADGGSWRSPATATDLVAGQVDANDDLDVFLYDRGAGTTALVSRTPGSGATAGNGPSDRPVISADGTVVAFESAATDLVAGQVGRQRPRRRVPCTIAGRRDDHAGQPEGRLGDHRRQRPLRGARRSAPTASSWSS